MSGSSESRPSDEGVVVTLALYNGDVKTVSGGVVVTLALYNGDVKTVSGGVASIHSKQRYVYNTSYEHRALYR